MRNFRRIMPIFIVLWIVTIVSANDCENPINTDCSCADYEQSDNNHLLDILRFVPDTESVQSGIVSYIDYQALTATRLDEFRFESYDEWQIAYDNESDEYGLWRSAFLGLSAGPEAAFSAIAGYRLDWRDGLGFDFFDINYAVGFGDAPRSGLVLQGNFNQETIVSTHTQRNYEVDDMDTYTLLCPPDGCDQDAQPDPANINPSNPFGGHFGREEPIALTDTHILNSPNTAVFQQLIDVCTDNLPSLAENPAYRAATEIIAQDGQIIQANFFHPDWLFADTPENDIPFPSYDLLVLSDTATDTQQIVNIVLVYDNENDAQNAVEGLPERIELYETAYGQKLTDFFDDLSITLLDTQVIAHEATGKWITQLTLYAPLSPAFRDDGQIVSASLVYASLMHRTLSFDSVWLAPGL